MTNGSQIRAVGDDSDVNAIQPDQAVPPPADDLMPGEDADGYTQGDEWADDGYPAPAQRRLPMVMAVLASLAVVGWTGFYLWANRAAMLGGAAPGQWIGWITQWAVPVLLVAVAWLIAMRSSAREATRFGNAARVLAEESALLESRLITVNRELSLAREFLAAQSRDLDYLGRSAAERISEHAARLQTLVVDNGAQVDAIANVSVTALENMTQLRDNLPVIANSARDVTNQIGGAGRSAKVQLGELVAGFERLNEFGAASERQVTSLRERIDAALEELASFVDTMDANNAARVETLRGETEGLRQALTDQEAATLAAMRERGAALREELAAAHEARQVEERAALADMREHLAAFSNEAHDAAAAVRAGEHLALEAWEGQVMALRGQLETALSEVARLDQQALETARQKLLALTAEAEQVDARLMERDREFHDRIARRQEDLESAEAAATARLAEIGGRFDAALAQRHETHTANADAIAAHGDQIARRLVEIEDHLAAIVQRGADADRALANSAEHFATAVGANAGQLEETETTLNRLTDASVRLLELIQAAAQHSRSELPASIAGFEQQLGTARGDSTQIRVALEDAKRLGDELQATLTQIHNAGETAMGGLDAFRSRLSGTAEQQGAALGQLREQLAAASAENHSLAEGVSGTLGAAIERLRETSQALLADLETGQEERIAQIAERIGSASGAAIDRAIDARTAEATARLDEATARSAEASREAVGQLRDQLARVHELTVNLETRAARAREQVEEQVDSDFARRMALITESLNSHAIDIAKALSTEVTDTAWASYLKGDRGIFTRRAVRLIDGSEAREIAALYENDHEFRDHVSRYIHDFEAMLRTMLSTRDGHALGVTLLSSDMGKLYVALAQAIQRLRQ